jgi:glycosyltransferase involved in cell wall biosynthesis
MNDVCLILEGSYPYATGGVSEWVDGLVGGLPELEFSVVHLRGEERHPARYVPPANVARIVEVAVDPERELALPDVDALPEARVYHALATGSAGVVGMAASRASGRPLVLTEHGLAWREAPTGGAWCRGGWGARPAHTRTGDRLDGYVRSVEASAREAYAHARAITTVCSENARLQRTQGARRELQQVIPNATPEAAPVPGDGAPRIGFVGRVSPIKDIATFLRACRLVADELPQAEFAVVGPLDQDPQYAARCLALAHDLGLRVDFAGDSDVSAWYERLDVVVLTSLSEAQPLVLLEAMARGIPVVATAVGGCSELVPGAGLLTPTRDPFATAGAILRLAADRELRRRLGANGRRRVARAHRPEQLLASYRAVYERAAA